MSLIAQHMFLFNSNSIGFNVCFLITGNKSCIQRLYSICLWNFYIFTHLLIHEQIITSATVSPPGHSTLLYSNKLLIIFKRKLIKTDFIGLQ